MVLHFHSKREYKIQTYLYVINYNLISTVDWVICDFMIKAAMRVHLVRSTTELGTFCRYVKSTSPSFSQLITHLFAYEPWICLVVRCMHWGGTILFRPWKWYFLLFLRCAKHVNHCPSFVPYLCSVLEQVGKKSYLGLYRTYALGECPSQCNA